jgi:hypothetical protein
VGYGDIVPVTSLEIIIAMLWMVCAGIFYMIIVSNLTTLIRRNKSKEAVLGRPLLLLDEFCHSTHLPKHLKVRLKRAFRYSIEKNELTYDDRELLMRSLPKRLKY